MRPVPATDDDSDNDDDYYSYYDAALLPGEDDADARLEAKRINESSNPSLVYCCTRGRHIHTYMPPWPCPS